MFFIFFFSSHLKSNIVGDLKIDYREFYTVLYREAHFVETNVNTRHFQLWMYVILRILTRAVSSAD